MELILLLFGAARLSIRFVSVKQILPILRNKVAVERDNERESLRNYEFQLMISYHIIHHQTHTKMRAFILPLPLPKINPLGTH